MQLEEELAQAHHELEELNGFFADAEEIKNDWITKDENLRGQIQELEA